MPRSARRPWLIATMTVATLAIVLQGYGHWAKERDRQRRETEINAGKARQAAADGLMAIRHGDTRRLKAVLFRQGFDWLTLEKSPRRAPRLVSYIATTYGIKTLTNLQIRRSLHVCGDQPVALMASVLRWGTVPPAWPHLLRRPICGFLLRCSLPNHALVIMCVKEGGSWKMVGLPALSARILRYHTIDEACMHGDAIAN